MESYSVVSTSFLLEWSVHFGVEVHKRWLIVRINTKAVIMPPSITMNICTVTPTVIILLSMVLNFILFSECVAKGSVGVIPCSKPSNSQWILSTTISYLELFVVKMGPGPVFKLKVNPQFYWPVFVKQLNALRPNYNLWPLLRSPNLSSYSFHFFLNVMTPSFLFLCITIHPPSVVSMSQYTPITSVIKIIPDNYSLL